MRDRERDIPIGQREGQRTTESERRVRRERWNGGLGVMSIIGFNIGALGKPVYKYPYGRVITT